MPHKGQALALCPAGDGAECTDPCLLQGRPPQWSRPRAVTIGVGGEGGALGTPDPEEWPEEPPLTDSKILAWREGHKTHQDLWPGCRSDPVPLGLLPRGGLEPAMTRGGSTPLTSEMSSTSAAAVVSGQAY